MDNTHGVHSVYNTRSQLNSQAGEQAGTEAGRHAGRQAGRQAGRRNGRVGNFLISLQCSKHEFATMEISAVNPNLPLPWSTILITRMSFCARAAEFTARATADRSPSTCDPPSVVRMLFT